jgi:hypothetical protein
MNGNDTIVNRVAKSPLITLDLEKFIPDEEYAIIDIKDQLYEGFVLREKDFRTFISKHDWSAYQNKNVALYCSVDAIIPVWAHMLITSKLQPFARFIYYGTVDELKKVLLGKALSRINLEEYRDKKVVIKGCSKETIPDSVYVEITQLLTPIVSSIMYGEPCSNVPVYKRKA